MIESKSIPPKPSSFIDFNDLFSNQGVRLVDKPADIREIVRQHLQTNRESAGFFLVNIKTVIDQYKKWVTHLPEVRPFYAVKCNPDPLILRVLLKLGCGFDCA